MTPRPPAAADAAARHSPGRRPPAFPSAPDVGHARRGRRGQRRARQRALAALCATEIVSYGVLYYAFPVLGSDITSATGWSATAVTAAFSAGNLTGALAGVPAGRLIDRHGPRPVMTAGSVLAVAALAGIAAAPSYWWFAAAWLLAGIAMAGVFYPPAFAALTGWHGPDRVRGPDDPHARCGVRQHQARPAAVQAGQQQAAWLAPAASSSPGSGVQHADPACLSSTSASAST
ncbi:MAG TPA: MFS transporter [Streptosporangiaceae bacterium]|nr:MFS transporter [Streptosporangiaceae bacterium]